MPPLTLNKNGKPRKTGSGKTKGAGCYEEISWSQLKNVIGENVKIPVSRVWLKNVGLSGTSSENKLIKKENIEMPKVSRKLPKPKVVHIKSEKKPTFPDKNVEEKLTYDPPPLFASGEINFDQF